MRADDIQGQFAPPQIALGRIRAVLAEQYGLEGDLAPLAGEREQNLLLGGGPAGKRHVVKIFRRADAPGAIAFQTRALGYLAQSLPDLPLPRVHRTRSGAAIHTLQDPENGPCDFRVLDYLEGQPVELGEAPTPALAAAAGQLVGAVTRTLGALSHDFGAEVIAWDVANGLLGDAQFWAMGGGDIRALEAHMRPRFAALMPVLRRQRTHVVYNDAHLENLLRPAPDADRITGLIDFGDMWRAPVVCDVATLALGFAEGAQDAPGMAAAAVSGYHAAYPLSGAEIDLIEDVMIARQVLSVILYDIKLADPALQSDENTQMRARLMERLERLLALPWGRITAAIHAILKKGAD
ncbi:hypothetical protein DC366_06200 [Pelagivirga sediminicola]|uniref:Aminoglycoside phosphotransferase domain-containing protein n=1 Tax=Pelagivirga sediminicola TaxID=2170575 RepID=A0A2T7GAA2_9RHOB|nr:phosphotransferase [Pelagivirga sediminicola]PVA11326.1 hypothetical protein DC366_06200 [Pelagivirga sediminicola]